MNDIPDLVGMCRRFHEFSGVSCGFAESAVADFMRGLIATGAVFRTDKGMIGGKIAPAWCDPTWKMAVEFFWWAEDRRGISLLREFERWAAENGANEVRMTTLETFCDAEKALRGYARTENSYSRVISWH